MNIIECSVSEDGLILTIDFPCGYNAILTRAEALELLEQLQEALPKMAVNETRKCQLVCTRSECGDTAKPEAKT